MVVLGSVFLGDAHQRRVFPTTPPTSPPPIGDSPLRVQQALRVPDTSDMSELGDVNPVQTQAQPQIERIPSISPELSLELRIRWLEALLFGVRQELTKESRNRRSDEISRAFKDGLGIGKNATLLRKAEEIQRKLNATIQSHEGVRKFMDRCESYRP